LDFHIIPSDVAENIAGFLPVGLVLGELGFIRAIAAGTLLSTFAETAQLVAVHRAPSPVDIASNVIGGILGALISVRWQIRAPGFTTARWKGVVAAVLAFLLVLALSGTSAAAINTRGSSSPGTLEAYWKLDEPQGKIASDSSGHGLHGKFRNPPKQTASVVGSISLDGLNDYIDFGHPAELRLAGSMTVSAWINSVSFPPDDAAIVSQLQSGLGYQLDTTIDKGPRTIGFKLANACGALMARYGATPLAPRRWYHVAGVYDANGRTLNVYLDGKLDNGPLAGAVTSTQHSSRGALYVGRRSDLKGYEFAGSIKDVRIYSFALKEDEIRADIRGNLIGSALQPAAGTVDQFRLRTQPKTPDPPCAIVSEPEDARIPAAAAMLGVLIAVACVCLWPSARPGLILTLSFMAGLLPPVSASPLPSLNLHLMSLVSLAGGASVVISIGRHKNRGLSNCLPRPNRVGCE
jgi:hypothetical protein